MICLDASVVVKLVLDEEHSEHARSLYTSLIAIQRPIIAPPLLPIELTNITRKQMRGPRGLPLGDANVLLEDLIALSIELHNPTGLHTLALAIASAYDLPATYDAHYLALSELLNCEFWTDDQRLVRQVRRGLPFVRWIGDYREP